MKTLVGFLLCIPFVIWAILRIVAYVHFNINCGGHMERAGTANSIDLAKQELEFVVRYAEDNRMTSGYTSAFWNTPDEDVGFWYKNMKTSLDELRKVKPDASELEKSNILIKLRESVMHHNKDGNAITAPDGLSVFPNNVAYAWFGIGALIIGCIGVLVIVSDERY